MASTSIARLNHQLEVARKSTRRAREKAGELMETALDSGIAGGTAMALGVWSKKSPGSFKDMAFGVPAPLALAIGGHAAALFGVGRGMEKHIKSMANGALAAHLFNVGQDMAVNAGTRQVTSGEGVSTADLVNLARNG